MTGSLSSDRGVCVLFGGGTNIFQDEIPFNDTWEWNGTVWTMRRSNGDLNQIRSGHYPEAIILFKRLTLQAEPGLVTNGR